MFSFYDHKFVIFPACGELTTRNGIVYKQICILSGQSGPFPKIFFQSGPFWSGSFQKARGNYASTDNKVRGNFLKSPLVRLDENTSTSRSRSKPVVPNSSYIEESVFEVLLFFSRRKVL